MSYTIIPAQPGFFLVYLDERPCYVYEEETPIIAWGLRECPDGNLEVLPITPQGWADRGCMVRYNSNTESVIWEDFV